MAKITNINCWQYMAERWKKGLYTAPGRPNSSEIAIYKKCVRQAIKGKKNPRALVLGATPELRDLLAELKIETFLCDMSIEMMLAMSEIIAKAKSEKEVWIKAPWEQNPMPDKSLDVIIGDLAIGNVPWALKNKFITKQYQLLKPGGHFIHRIFFQPEHFFTDAQSILNFFDELKYNPIRHTELLIYLTYLSFDKKKRCVDTSIVPKLLKNKKLSPKLKKIIKKMNQAWSPYVKTWDMDDEAHILKLFNKEFELAGQYQGKQHLCVDWFQIYDFKKK